MKIEGIPEGWEQEKVGQISFGEYWVNNFGQPQRWDSDHPSSSKNYVIIRKKPKQYRPFANAAEAEPFWDKKLRMKEWRAKEPGKAMFRINAIGDEDVSIGFQVYSYQSAFDIYECIDGTPFGIEVTE